MRRFMFFLMLGMGISPLMALADIQPMSGTWQGQVALLAHDDCPQQMAEQMPNAFAETGSYGPQQITFPDPFTPESLAGDFTWVRLAENHWRAAFQEVTETGVGPLVTDQSIDLFVRSETELEQLSRLQVTFPAAMAQMLGTSAPCVVSSRVDHRYVGP